MLSNDFRIEESGTSLFIRDEKSNTYLRADLTPNQPALDVHVKAPTGITTGRSFGEYKTLFPDLQVPYGKQLMEFGGGLSELITLTAAMHKDRLPEQKPVLIDIADYALIRDMLRFAQKETPRYPILRQKRKKIAELLTRCETILNPDLVRLVNSNLRTALEQHPDLAQKADIAIDAFGPLHYMETEYPAVGQAVEGIRRATEELLQLEHKFLKKGGVLLQHL